MNREEAATYQDIRAVLQHSVEASVRMARTGAGGDERDAEDDQLIDAEHLEAIPERARPAVRAAAQRLRELAAMGDRVPADAAVGREALALVGVLPRRWRLPRQDPAELAARVRR